ncbi:MAG: hypothetical protein Q9M50_11200 [Methylococcales bacterium]|nr:hypothetical protein [Methylococcales bacterium]
MKILLYGVLLLFSIQIYADNINQRTDLSPSTRLSVNKHIAKSYVQKEKDYNNNADKVNIEKNGTKEDNGSQIINSFSDVNDVPDEVVTVVGGDIVNICFRCR